MIRIDAPVAISVLLFTVNVVDPSYEPLTSIVPPSTRRPDGFGRFSRLALLSAMLPETMNCPLPVLFTTTWSPLVLLVKLPLSTMLPVEPAFIVTIIGVPAAVEPRITAPRMFVELLPPTSV